MKSRHSSLLLILILLFEGRASALQLFECVRGLLPITERAAKKLRRVAVDAPFLLNNKYLIFVEPLRRASHSGSPTLNGYYVFSSGQAKYYDAISKQLSSDDRAVGETSDQRRLGDLSNSEMQNYRMLAQPNGLETIILTTGPTAQTLVRLQTATPKSEEELWRPLRSELALRKAWIQSHNLPESDFRELSRLMAGVCQN